MSGKVLNFNKSDEYGLTIRNYLELNCSNLLIKYFQQVRYERVNIDDIDTSSDDDDYGDLFANERGRILSNGRRSKLPARKGTGIFFMTLF